MGTLDNNNKFVPNGFYEECETVGFCNGTYKKAADQYALSLVACQGRCKDFPPNGIQLQGRWGQDWNFVCEGVSYKQTDTKECWLMKDPKVTGADGNT